MYQMRGLSGKVAIVSGGSRGIGKSIALRLVREGVNVFITAEELSSELSASKADCNAAAQGGAKAESGVFDLANEGAAEAMVAGAVAAFGRVDILVNNAGIRGAKKFGEFTYQDFNSVIAVNLRAPFFASQAVIPLMKANGGGRIIHISSQHGIVANHERTLYGVTKAALAYLARGMAYELSAHNILVNAISPGPIASDAFKERVAADPIMEKRLLSYVPLGRPGEPDEVASAVAFLASDEASFIQGHNLVIDGGYIIH
jgi:NAD(P)-dependent dehydrogenase (short-subunit alcohol dehydrogenase family)